MSIGVSCKCLPEERDRYPELAGGQGSVGEMERGFCCCPFHLPLLSGELRKARPRFSELED